VLAEGLAASCVPIPSAEVRRERRRIDSHTDQLIIAGSLILGFWLIGKSIYLIVS
jgi:hypothetical protein